MKDIKISINEAIEFAEELKTEAINNRSLVLGEVESIKIYLDRMIIKLMDVKVNQRIKEIFNVNSN